MRPIDADALTKDLTYDFTGHPLHGNMKTSMGNIRAMILAQPTIEAVPVVRCRECENYDENGDCISLDLRIGIHSDTINYDFCPDPDFYCAYGRRKIETVLPKSDEKDESLEADHEVSE